MRKLNEAEAEETIAEDVNSKWTMVVLAQETHIVEFDEPLSMQDAKNAYRAGQGKCVKREDIEIVEMRDAT